MTLWTEALAGLDLRSRVKTGEGWAIVPTHCLYPSNSLVRVVVEGGVREFIVRDDGGALQEAAHVGIDPDLASLQLRHIITPQGLKIDKGVIYSPVVPVEQLAATIMLVANTSKEAAHYLLDHFRPRRRRNFLEDLARLLDELYFGRIEHDTPISGASNKVHKFRHVIRLKGELRMIVDPVINEQTSISSRVLANLDVSQRGEEKIIQRIVYDETERWKAADLRLLRLGATAVPFGEARDVIPRAAA